MERAVSLARQNAARLKVFTVVKEFPANARMAITVMSSGELLELVINERQEMVDALAADISQQGVDVGSQVVTGAPFLEIIHQVLRDKHDLVILAAEGKGGLEERLFGSELHLVQVWSVFGERYLETRGGLSKQSVHRLRQETRNQYTTQLNSLLINVDLKGVGIRRHLPRNDDTPRTIIKLAKGNKIDLLVMGTVCRTGVAGFFIGNTAEKVLSEVNCSVLTVKPEGFVTPVTMEVG